MTEYPSYSKLCASPSSSWQWQQKQHGVSSVLGPSTMLDWMLPPQISCPNILRKLFSFWLQAVSPHYALRWLCLENDEVLPKNYSIVVVLLFWSVLSVRISWLGTKGLRTKKTNSDTQYSSTTLTHSYSDVWCQNWFFSPHLYGFSRDFRFFILADVVQFLFKAILFLLERDKLKYKCLRRWQHTTEQITP